MSNFGALHLRVVNPFELAFREARSAVGHASEILANADEFSALAEAVADCSLVIGTTAIQHREVQHPLHLLSEGAARLRRHLLQSNAAIVFGSEKTGLSNDDLSHCHWLMHIPAREEHLSMNLGQAVAVTLYEIARGPAARPDPIADCDNSVSATSAELERLTSILSDALQASGYSSPDSVAATEEKTRRMLRRMNLTARDAEVLLGMLRQILWKLHLS